VVNDMEPVLAMALGAGETTPFKLTAAYSAFLNGGRRINPHLIEVVQDREGKVIYRSDKRDCPACSGAYGGEDPPMLEPMGKQIFDPITAYQITSMLQGVVAHGTAFQAHILGTNVGGKTGTTNEFRSAWFVGFTPKMVAGVFVGFDDNRSLGDKETGAVAAVPIFIDFMQQAIKVRPVGGFRPPPSDAKFLLVNGSREAFRNGTEPNGSGGEAGAQPAVPGTPPGLPAPVPANQPAAPPPKQPQDLNGLF
jgi:penicillin-binding protein 1A